MYTAKLSHISIHKVKLALYAIYSKCTLFISTSSIKQVKRDITYIQCAISEKNCLRAVVYIYICLCKLCDSTVQDHHLSRLSSGSLDDVTWQISMIWAMWVLRRRFEFYSLSQCKLCEAYSGPIITNGYNLRQLLSVILHSKYRDSRFDPPI